MNIVIIGTGNAATVLGRKFRQAGHTILQVAGRDSEATALLAGELEAGACTDWNAINAAAEFYLIAVSDNALPELQQKLRLPGRLVAHTAGSVSKEVLKQVSDRYGVFYPLQSLRREITVIPEIPFLVDGNDERTKDELRKIAGTLSTRVSEAGDLQRLQLHLAAVVVNNFTNHLYALAENYCSRNGLPFHYLLPLIEETAHRLEEFSPAQVQTGPAVRNDTDTIRRHLELLKDDRQLKEVYTLMTRTLMSATLRE
jgi:predicted short-subunit dehydrogenase-like oxidoreductase (DUF2520 family)